MENIDIQTSSKNISNEISDLQYTTAIKHNFSEFILTVGIIKDSIYFELINQKKEKFMNIFSLTSLKIINIWFNQFSSLDKIFKVIKRLMNENKFQIKEEINSENILNIFFYNPLDEEDIITIKLNKKEESDKETIKYLLEIIDELKEKNTLLENKINKIEEKYDTLQKQINQINDSNNQAQQINIQKNFSIIKTNPTSIKCNKCGAYPIVGYGYTCSVCKDYNLCEECEQKNYEIQEHEHPFIKIRLSEKYNYGFLDDNPELFSKIVEYDKRQDIEFNFTIINKSQIDFPGNGRTKLELDKENSSIKIEDIILKELKPEQNMKIIINILKEQIKLGKNKIILKLNIDGNNYGKPIYLNIQCKSKVVEDTRSMYNLDKEYNDDEIYNLLSRHNFDPSKLFIYFID